MNASLLRTLVTTLSLTLALVACNAPEKGEKPAAKAQRPAHLVEVLRVKPESLAPQRMRSGTLIAERVLKVVAREEGVLLELPFHPGDKVAKGALLYRLDDALLSNQLTQAEASLKEAVQNLKRMRRLSASKSVAVEQLLAAETAEAVARATEEGLRLRIGYTRLKAPFAALVSERLAEQGEFISARQPLLTLIDPTALITQVTLSELLLAQLQVGDQASLRIEALGAEAYSGRIVRIHPQIDPLTRQGIVEVLLDPAPQGARPGQLAQVTFTTHPEPRLMVPFAALRSDPEGEYLYLFADGKAQRRPVRSGVAVGQRVSIVEGLSAGEQVIVRGLLDLRDGKSVQLAGAKTAEEAK